MATFKLESPQVSLNAPNIKFKRIMTDTRTVPWSKTAHEMLGNLPANARHLVLNCHGFAWREQFQAPHLSIGTVIHPGNVSAFDPIASISSLLVIWLSACSLTSSSDGVEFCKSIAKHSKCYVVSQALAAPDVSLPKGHTDDNSSSMPYYVNPEGQSISRKTFLDLAGALHFTRV